MGKKPHFMIQIKVTKAMINEIKYYWVISHVWLAVQNVPEETRQVHLC